MLEGKRVNDHKLKLDDHLSLNCHFHSIHLYLEKREELRKGFWFCMLHWKINSYWRNVTMLCCVLLCWYIVQPKNSKLWAIFKNTESILMKEVTSLVKVNCQNSSVFQDVYFCSAGDQTQCLAHAQHVFYHWAVHNSAS